MPTGSVGFFLVQPLEELQAVERLSGCCHGLFGGKGGNGGNGGNGGKGGNGDKSQGLYVRYGTKRWRVKNEKERKKSIRQAWH